MNSLKDIVAARRFLAREYEDLDVQTREQMLPVVLAVQAAIRSGLDGNRAVVAACAAHKLLLDQKEAA